jgi:hypothetical protein
MLAILPLFALLATTFDATLPPATAHVVLTAEGRGVQIYRCQQQAGNYIWTFVAPEATLIDGTTHQTIGTHRAGPTWTSTDGSSITGQVLKKYTPPSADDIPWLLLSASPASHPGVLAQISLVRRSQTHAGNAPNTGCDAGHTGQTIRVPYTATYTFYTGQ